MILRILSSARVNGTIILDERRLLVLGISNSNLLIFNRNFSEKYGDFEEFWFMIDNRALSNMLTAGAITPSVEQIASPVTGICPCSENLKFFVPK